jgi:RHS repeat-associated protein
MTSYKAISQKEYDRLGQLRKKIIAPAFNNNAGLETMSYDYNIRGWSLGVNRDYVKDINSNNYFGFDVGYDKQLNGLINNQSYTAAQYTGNITGTVWKSKGDGEKRKYDFTYDIVNRLLKADFGQYTSGSFNQDAGVNYDIKMGDGLDVNSAYDANGNILKLQQWGLKINTSEQIDNLSYNYLSNSNKLAKVIELLPSGGASGTMGDFKDGSNGSSDDYDYDFNGNSKFDNNKNISSIVYNHLNLPSVFTVSGKGTITYTYDGFGNKLKKEIAETGQSLKTSLYVGPMVYENDVLQFIAHEEGRLRFKPQAGSVAASFQYDYMLKDNLGNVRMVLTEEQQQDRYPTATLEGSGTGSPVEKEKDYYDFNSAFVVNKPANTTPTNLLDYVNDNGTNNPNTFGDNTAISLKMYKLNAGTNRTGLSMVLKVMAGDKINILGKSYYQYSGGVVSNTPITGSSIIAALLSVGGSGNLPAAHGATSTGLNNNVIGTLNPLNLFSTNNPINPSNNVKAGINYIVLDEQFKYISGSFDPVSANTSGGLKAHLIPNIPIPKNGYIYIYCSNESNIDIFFDNLEVVHDRGPILEETHYYPFGLTMAGISTKSANSLANKTLYNSKEKQSKEFVDGTGLELNDFGFRMQDPQIGIWLTADPLADKYYSWSPYNYCINNPLNVIDPLGLDIEKITGGWRFTGEDAQSAFDIITNRKKNALIDVRSEEEGSEKVNYKKDPNYYGQWAVFSTGSLKEGIDMLRSFENNSINNLAIATHGWAGMFENKPLKQNDEDDQVLASEITNYNTNKSKNNAKTNDLIGSVAKIGDKISKNGNIIFIACFSGKGAEGKELLAGLNTLFRNKANVFFTHGLFPSGIKRRGKLSSIGFR